MEVTMRALKGQAIAIFASCTREEVETLIGAKASIEDLYNEQEFMEELGLGHISAKTKIKMSYDVHKDAYSFAGDFTAIGALIGAVAMCDATTSEDP